ncbi:MAG: ion transporter [Flavobacteriales bacterium]|nr:ion transporter [Flavobacteriales bacterium]
MEKLRNIIEQSETKSGRWLDLFIQLLILLSLVSFSLETLPDLTEKQQLLLDKFELFCIVIFCAEYSLRIIVARKKLKFVFSFFGIIDLLAILPFFLTMGVDLRSLRIFRLLRLFRAFKLVRYNKAVHRFHLAFGIVKEELILFLSVASMILFLSGAGIYFFENKAQPEAFSSVFASLWWAITTLTTVGYGDIYPVTVGGKIFTFFVLLVGLGVVSIPAGLVASALSKARELETQESSSRTDR